MKVGKLVERVRPSVERRRRQSLGLEGYAGTASNQSNSTYNPHSHHHPQQSTYMHHICRNNRLINSMWEHRLTNVTPHTYPSSSSPYSYLFWSGNGEKSSWTVSRKGEKLLYNANPNTLISRAQYSTRIIQIRDTKGFLYNAPDIHYTTQKRQCFNTPAFHFDTVTWAD